MPSPCRPPVVRPGPRRRLEYAPPAGSLVLLCCHDGDGDWAWDTLRTVGLAVFAAHKPFRNTLDPQTRLDFLADSLDDEARWREALVDANAVLWPVVGLVPLLSHEPHRVRAYADFLDAARPRRLLVDAPLQVTPELYFLCGDVREALHSADPTAWLQSTTLHARALLQAVREYKDSKGGRLVVYDKDQRRLFLAALYQHLQAEEVAGPLDVPDGLLRKRVKAYSVEAVRQHVLKAPRHTAPAQLNRLANSVCSALLR